MAEAESILRNTRTFNMLIHASNLTPSLMSKMAIDSQPVAPLMRVWSAPKQPRTYTGLISPAESRYSSKILSLFFSSFLPASAAHEMSVFVDHDLSHPRSFAPPEGGHTSRYMSSPACDA